ncbi:MAG: hypothetical protein LBB50_01465, partial [Oscillospiraceae bacterium]|nr:hypothetical protein [Oscillospiraceae bacterium]
RPFFWQKFKKSKKMYLLFALIRAKLNATHKGLYRQRHKHTILQYMILSFYLFLPRLSRGFLAFLRLFLFFYKKTHANKAVADDNAKNTRVRLCYF